MNRLRDEAGDDPVAVRGIELLRGTPPAARTPEAKRRVWMAIQRAHTTKAHGFRLPKLRMAAVVIGVLCMAGSAGAVIARRWIVPVFRGISSPAPSAPIQGQKASPVRTVGLRHAPAGSSLPMAVAPGLPARVASAAAVATVAPTRAPVRKVAPLRRVSTSPALAGVTPSEMVGGLPAPTAATARERTQVLDAMVALRRDHDPISAGRMLDRYLTAHPMGALREEALVLAIEAAGARGDVAFARSLARQYQSAYPTGRFRQFAQSAARP
jgi:hypothetical protein